MRDTPVKSLVLLAAILASSSGRAQQAQPAGGAPAAGAANGATMMVDGTRREQAIRHLLEEQVRQVLRRYVQDNEFHAQVEVQSSTKNLDKIPYLPAIESGTALAAFTPERLINATEKVDVTIALAKRYKEKTRTKLSQILTLALGLRQGSDSVKFDDLDLELPPQRSDLEINLMRIEADLRNERNKGEQIRRERDDLKMEIVATKTQAEKAKDATATDPKKAQTPEAAAQTAAAKDGDVTVNRAKDFGVPALFALIGLVIAFLLSRAFTGIGRGISDAAGAVSQAIEASANTAAQAAMPQAQAGGAQQEAARSAGDSGGSGTPLESFQKVLKELHEDLAQRLNDQTQPHVVRYLTQQLTNTDTTPKGVAAMELFGREHANFLFQNLNPQAQSTVLDFIRNGQYKRPKHELMLEAGEELKTRLLGEAVMQTVSPVGQDIAAKIVAFQIEDLARAVLGMPEKTAARLLRYLEPGRIAALLTEIHRTAAQEVARIAETIMKVPEAGDDKDLDRELLQALTTAQAAKGSDVHKPYLKFYGEILSAVDDQVSEAMFGKFMANPQVATYIRRNTITFSMFFQVTKDIQEEILGLLSIKDLAALYTGLTSQEEKDKINTLVPARRLEAVVEEAQQMVTRGNRQVQVAFRQAKQAVCNRLTAIQRAGNLEFADDQAPAAGAASQQAPTAA